MENLMCTVGQVRKLVRCKAKMVQKLLDAGIKITIEKGKRENRPKSMFADVRRIDILHIALLEGKMELVEYLMSKFDITEDHLRVVPYLSNWEVLIKFLQQYFSFNTYDILEYVKEKKLLKFFLKNNKVEIATELFNHCILRNQAQI